MRQAGSSDPRPEAVTAELFCSGEPFFFALDKVQVKYEMLRAHFGDGATVVSAAVAHGYSRGGFYLVADTFAESGMAGLLDERRGRKGPLKLTEEITTFLHETPATTTAPEWVSKVATTSVSPCTGARSDGRERR